MKKVKFPLFTHLDAIKDAVNGFVTSTHQHILKTKVVFEANNYARKNLPEANDPSIEPYLDTTRGAYGSLRREVSLRIQGGVKKLVGSLNLDSANQQIDANRTGFNSASDKEKNLEIDKGRIHTSCDLATYNNKRWIAYALAVGEIVWITSAFLYFGDIVLLALLIGAAVGFAQLQAVKGTVQVIKEQTEPFRQKKYAILALIVFSIFSLLLGGIRYWIAHQHSDAPFYVLNPFLFAAITMLFILAMAGVIWRYFPSKEDEKLIEKIVELNKEIAAVRAQKEELNAQHTTLLQQRDYLLELYARTAHAENCLTARIDELYDEAVGQFKSENSAKRSDGVFPSCFRIPHLSLSDQSTNAKLVTN